MRWRWILACLACLFWPQFLCARLPQVERREARLVCGGTRFFARTVFIRSAPVSQVMTARIWAFRPAVSVELRESKIPYPYELGASEGLASIVSAWQCRKTPAGHVLVLWYSCPQDLREEVPDAFCSSTGEWERYVALDGSLLDQGFSFEDSRYEALRRRLGYHDRPDQAGDEGPFIWFH